jgi:hypothetical protein
VRAQKPDNVSADQDHNMMNLGNQVF